MVGPTKPTADQSSFLTLEIDGELGEEGQSLVGGSRDSSSSTITTSDGGGSLLSYFCFVLDSSRLYKLGAAFVGLILLVATYHVGKGQGRANVTQHAPAVDHPGAPLPSPSVGKAPEVAIVAKAVGDEPTYKSTPEVAKTAGDDGPTYKPTEAKSDNDGPTYKPTEAPRPEETTPQPTLGKHSWIDPDYPNPFVTKFNTTEWINFHKKQWFDRTVNAVDIREKYGIYCPNEPNVPMCPPLDADGNIIDVNQLSKGPTLKCIDTGNKKERCGVGNPWLNKTIWPLIRGPFCAKQDQERKQKHPLPNELEPYFELGYDRVDPKKSKDAPPFDGGRNQNNNNLLPFDPTKVNEHFLKFEAMLEHHYQGLARPLLERQLRPMPEDALYAPMLKSYSDQIAKALLRASEGSGEDSSKVLVIGVLGDSVTSGQDNCYFDAWPEVFRRQITPLFAAMGLEVEVVNAAKNGGWHLAPQLLCANDMLGVLDQPNEKGLDFLFICNPFVKAHMVDAEHLVRRALLGKTHTVVSISVQEFLKGEELLSRYAELGLSIGTPFQDTVPELGIPNGHKTSSFKYWFPDQQKAFWGMQGDGFCHLTTRSGSSSVVNRNWHWGPKMHQTYADAYALLFSRAARQAIGDLSAGRMPLEPRKPNEVARVTREKDLKTIEHGSWKTILFSDMGSEEAVQGGIAGVRCAIGPANQSGSTLLPHWLRPAEGSPFEEKMKARNGVSFVPADHDADDSRFYKVQSPISTPNTPVHVGDWVANPKTFGAEAPRTAVQCRHMDGSTLVNMKRKHNGGILWLVWEVPKGAVSVGHALICGLEIHEIGNVRFHYAVPSKSNGEWKIIEDSHNSKPFSFVKEDCLPMIAEMNEGDLEAVREGGMWAAVEWKEEEMPKVDYLVVI